MTLKSESSTKEHHLLLPSTPSRVSSVTVSPIGAHEQGDRKRNETVLPSSPVSGGASENFAPGSQNNGKISSTGSDTGKSRITARNPKMSLRNLVSPYDEPHILPTLPLYSNKNMKMESSQMTFRKPSRNYWSGLDFPALARQTTLSTSMNYFGQLTHEQHLHCLTAGSVNPNREYTHPQNALQGQKFAPVEYPNTSCAYYSGKEKQHVSLNASQLCNVDEEVQDRKQFPLTQSLGKTSFSIQRFDSITTSALSLSSEPKAKRPWTESEDVVLRELVQKLGPGLWAAMAQQIPGRTGKQVRERWLNHLSPGVTKRPWSAEEDSVIIENHKRMGNCWSRIAKLLQGRSDNSVKNRYYTTLRRRICNGSGISTDNASIVDKTRQIGGRKRYLEDSISGDDSDLGQKRARVWE